MRKFWVGYWFKGWHFAYKIGFSIVITGARTYYRNFMYLGKEKIPKNAGIIYAINHQNAFLDPIAVAGQTNNPIHFLARSDIFKNKFAEKILRQLYMLPIYRKRDGVDTISKNQKTFEECHDILKNKGHLVIFPEGNHNFKKHLRSLKKGISRIALGTLSRHGENTPLYIVPLGIDYENHFSMNADILLNVGEPIVVKKYYHEFINYNAETINKLTNKVSELLKDLLLDINDQENYEEIYYLLHRVPLKSKNIIEKFKERKNKLSNLKSLKNTDLKNYKKIISDAKLLKSFVENHKIRAYLFSKPPMSLFKFYLTSFLMCLFLPFHLILLTTNYFPYKIPVWFVEKNIKDKHFHGSLKQALGVILFIGYWSMILLLTLVFYGWKFFILSAILLPIFAKINLKYWIQFIKLKGTWRFRKSLKHKNFNKAKEAFENIQKNLSL
ncbi:MAG: hypothetical protein CL827_03820 [Crocinitomicaceae bacterium]|nr:hypothetical protein [Crocinitomicaceae bacterium]